MSSRIKTILLWMSILLLLASCMAREGDSKNNVASHPTASVSLPLTVTRTPTSVPPSPTSTILPTVPSLSGEEAFALLYDMLHAGRTCELPCWLHITPGQSSYSDANFKWGSFLQLAGTTKVSPRDFLYYFDYTTDNDDIFINTRIYLSPDSEFIESIRIDTQVLRYIEIGKPDRAHVYDSNDYDDLLHAYFLPSILSTYGLPTQIVLSTDISSAEPTSPDYFSIWLLYPTRGAIIQYKGTAEIKGNSISACPSDTFVSIWLVDLGNTKLYENTLISATGHNNIVTGSPYYKSTMESIGMSTEEFYEIFKNPTDHCIESPLDIWPEP